MICETKFVNRTIRRFVLVCGGRGARARVERRIDRHTERETGGACARGEKNRQTHRERKRAGAGSSGWVEEKRVSGLFL